MGFQHAIVLLQVFAEISDFFIDIRTAAGHAFRPPP